MIKRKTLCGLQNLFRYLGPRNVLCALPKNICVVQPVFQLIHVTWLYVVEGNRVITAAHLSLQTEGKRMITALLSLQTEGNRVITAAHLSMQTEGNRVITAAHLSLQTEGNRMITAAHLSLQTEGNR